MYKGLDPKYSDEPNVKSGFDEKIAQVVKYLASHHCPLQSGGADKESKMDCPRYPFQKF